MRPPVKYKPNPNIIPTFALIRLCHLHGMSNPACPDRNYYRTLLEQWSKLVTQMIDRGYILNYSGFPISYSHKLRDEMPALKSFGITRIRRETWRNWGNMTPGIYIAAKLMWDTDTDVDALEQDFYDKFFGPASAPMARYLQRLDQAFYNVDHHPRWEDEDMAKVLPPDSMKASNRSESASTPTAETNATSAGLDSARRR